MIKYEPFQGYDWRSKGRSVNPCGLLRMVDWLRRRGEYLSDEGAVMKLYDRCRGLVRGGKQCTRNGTPGRDGVHRCYQHRSLARTVRNYDPDLIICDEASTLKRKK